jgi:hypothetical protein
MIIYFVTGAVVLLAVLVASFIAQQRVQIYDDADLEANVVASNRAGNTASSHRAGNTASSARANSAVKNARVTSLLDNVSILHFYF